MGMSSSRGVVLLLVIVFGLILSIIGIAAIENTSQQQILARNLLSEKRAHQIAYAGIELGRKYISQCRTNFGKDLPLYEFQYRFPEHISTNRNPIMVPIPPEFTKAIQSQGSLSVSIIPDTGNITQVLLPATDYNISHSIMGKYTISSTATITSGISGAMDVIKNISIRVYVKKTGTFLTLSYIDNYNDESNGWPSLVLPYPRADFTMTLSTTNVILIAGGIFSSFPPTFTYSDSPLNTVYSGSSLSNADLLYLTNTGAEAFKPKGGMNVARAGHTATLLGTGDILVAGGTDSAGTILSSAETYNAPSGAFSLCPNPMKAPRSNACAVPLTDGNALIAGGYSTGVAPTSSAEVYTTATGKFNFTSSMALPRAGAAAVRLNDGSVLMVGGIQTTGVYTRQAEVYTYPAGVFTLVGALAEPRYQPTATLLDDGTVLVCGGYTGNSHHPLTAEIYNPATHAFTPTTGAPIHSRFGSTATLLPTGQVLIAGGIIDSALGPIITDSAELYNPLNKTFYPLEGFVGQASYNVVDGAANVQVGYVLRNMIYPTVGHRAIRGGPIPPDWVLIVGGFSGWSYLESTQTFILSFDLEEIKNSYVEGPIIRKTHQ